MDTFVAEIIKLAPALAIMLYINVQQQRQINRLIDALFACCDDDDDSLVREVIANGSKS